MQHYYSQGAETLHITTLGSFSLTRGNSVISEQSRRSQKIWTLLKYILTNRKRRIPAEEFYDVLWANEDCANPSKALQNLIYRLRIILSAGTDMEINAYIQFSQGCYYWKPLYPVDLDCDEFEKLVADGLSAEQKETPYEAIDCYRKAMALYRGGYLSDTSPQEWISSMANYYQRLYLNMVHRMAYLLRALNNPTEAAQVCEDAFVVEPYEEPLHVCYLEALMDMGKVQQAQKHYEFITSALHREFGIRPSPALRAAHERIYEDLDVVQTDLDEFQSTLAEVGTNFGAFYCEPEIFRQIYRLESRRCDRSGQVEFFIVITLAQKESSDIALREAMDIMGEVLMDTLRKGDVVCRWNESQFVLLLPTITFEDGEMVLGRLSNRFGLRYAEDDVSVKHKLQPLRTTAVK